MKPAGSTVYAKAINSTLWVFIVAVVVFRVITNLHMSNTVAKVIFSEQSLFNVEVLVQYKHGKLIVINQSLVFSMIHKCDFLIQLKQRSRKNSPRYGAFYATFTKTVHAVIPLHGFK